MAKKELESRDDLLKEIERLKKVNSALMDRVERGNSSGGSFSLFEKNVNLASLVKERTLELEKLTTALESEKLKLSGIILTLPGAIIIFDKDFNVDSSFDTFLEDRFNTKRGPTLEEVVGLELFQIVAKKVHMISKNHENVLFDFPTFLNNKEVNYTCSVSSRDMNQYVLYIHDNTEKFMQERLIRNQEARILQSSKLASLGEMAAGVAHEINNPLAIINVATDRLRNEMLRNNINNPSLKNTIDIIELTVARISKIITVMRAISKESNVLNKEKVPLMDIINDVFALCGERFKNNNIDLRLNISPQNLEHLICCERIQFSQVLLNLLNNAFDATEGHPDSWVEVSYLADPDYDVIQVMNSGIKISDEIIAKIFNPFFTTKEVGRGTGLGLPVSKSIMENHHGSIELLPSSKYTCFVLKLPKI